MTIRIKIRPNAIRKLEAAVRGGAKAVSEKLHKVIIDETNKWAKGLIRAIETDTRFTELKSSEDLRGVLGMPRKQFRRGSDTDAEDLIALLNTYQVKATGGIRFKKVNVKFPTLKILEERLVRSLSSISTKGAVRDGPLQSWFRWWEFGDQGEITSLTVLRRNIGKLAQAQGLGQGKSRANLTRLINQRSRSGAALQIASRPAGGDSRVDPRGLVSEKYASFAKIFPARISKKVNEYMTTNRTRIQSLFARARTS